MLHPARHAAATAAVVVPPTAIRLGPEKLRWVRTAHASSWWGLSVPRPAPQGPDLHAEPPDDRQWSASQGSWRARTPRSLLRRRELRSDPQRPQPGSLAADHHVLETRGEDVVIGGERAWLRSLGITAEFTS